MKQKFDDHNEIARERYELQQDHLEFLRREVKEDRIAKDLEILHTSEENLPLRRLVVLRKARAKIEQKYLDEDGHRWCMAVVSSCRKVLG